ncbi:hypothetical protein NPX13_g8015 [Xylaria arbuscula]|uniref:Uncharacterized protein n=1 Tax=Xylaria arbuscula TaxID=114810 RepID=A0A9W8TIQ8_9PEZI|nr:hypothetical protein NPX13_g8015 [Xylaria arbuscula]
MEALANWTTASPPAAFVAQTGVWTNWSRGRILGATLSLSRQNGNLLIAFTAFFVGLVSSRFWRIVCFILHRYYASPAANDVLHHQQQAILRNSPSPDSGIWALGQLSWAWRHSAKRSFIRVLPSFICAVISLTAFAVASGFSSHVSTGISDEVLVKSNDCGLLDPSGNLTIETGNIFHAKVDEDIAAAANYAQQCYMGNSSNVFDCATGHFVLGRLPTILDSDADCPFTTGLCRNNTGNIRLDTGYLSSNDHFGLNSPADQHILFRRVMQCAPLNTIAFKKEAVFYNYSTGVIVNYTRYYYGPVPSPTKNITTSFTFEAPSIDQQHYAPPGSYPYTSSGRTYRLVALQAEYYNGSIYDNNANFIPIDALNANGTADIAIIFLSGNGVAFEEQTNDPWYRGTVPIGEYSSVTFGNSRKTGFLAEESASPLGCVTKFQFCSMDIMHCGLLAGYWDAIASASPIFNSTAEEQFTNYTGHDGPSSRFSWFQPMAVRSDPVTVVNTLGAQSLLSVRGMRGGFQSAIPDNQWQLDVANWWATSLAGMQSAGPTIAQGPQGDQYKPITIYPGDKFQDDMCQNQKVRSTDYTSFSLFGLYFIFVTGLLIVIASYILEPLFACLRHRGINETYKLLEWQTNEALQLQRIAYQGLGEGEPWSRFINTIPLSATSRPLEPLALQHGDPCSSTPSVSHQSTISSGISEQQKQGNEDNSPTIAAAAVPTSTISYLSQEPP